MIFFKKYKIIFLLCLILSLYACNDEKTNTVANTKKYNIASVHFNEVSYFLHTREAFFKEMEKQGYNENNFTFHVKNAKGIQEDFANIVEEITTSDKYDVIISTGTFATKTIMQKKNKEQAQLFTFVENPVTANITQNPQQPENNVTGVAIPMHVTRLVDIAKQLTPNMKTIAILSENFELQTTNIVESAKSYLSFQNFEVKEILIEGKASINSLSKEDFADVDCIFMPNSNFLHSHIKDIIKVAREAKVPIYCGSTTLVKNGALASVSISVDEVGEVVARFIVNIIEGKDIKDLPIYVTPSRIITINEDVIEDLNIIIPDTMPAYNLVKSEN